MAVTTPCLCTREDVKRAPDIKSTARIDWQIDRIIQSVTEDIQKHLHRKFLPLDATFYFDWPNFQYAYPWRLWLNQYNLAAIPTQVTTGGETIPLSACNFEPVNSGPPFTYLELRRDLSYSFGAGPTPQRDIAITGTWGHWLQTDPAGTLAAVVTSATATSITVSDASVVGVGQILIADTERLVVADRANIDTGQTNLSGVTNANTADVSIGVTDGTQLHVGEVVQLDSERMLVIDITGNTATVKRAWDGTVLATHATGTHIYAQRALTVLRGQLGTTAATHSNGIAISTWRIPSLLRDLAVAETVVRVIQETGGYSNTQGEGESATKNIGAGLPALWDKAETAFGRKARIRVI